jgi:hypothetical protein
LPKAHQNPGHSLPRHDLDLFRYLQTQSVNREEIFEHTVRKDLKRLEAILLEAGIEVTDLRRTRESPLTEFSLLLKSRERPGCIFGFKSLTWNEWDDGSDAAELADIFVTNFIEASTAGDVDPLSVTCDGQEIVWIS